MHSHTHHHGTGAILKWSFFATLLFVGIELFAGIRANSLALISDAGHNFTDALSLVLAAIGFYLQSKPPNSVKTYGYHRAGVLTAFVNALTLVGIAIFIFYEAWHRFLIPHPVQEWTMLWVAIAALVLNGAVMWGLNRDKDHDLNIRAAFMHMLGDAVSSVAIIGGAIAIHFTGLAIIDPILSVLIGLMIIWTAWDIIQESLNVLLEGLPRGLELSAVTGAMRQVDGVIDVHDLHIWSLGSSAHALSCHVLIEDMPPSASNAILLRINELLCNFQIHHSTIQFEHTMCAASDNPCSIVVPHQHEHEHHH
ncbi:MAG TPA: cation diffusion facilitator family transporter [Bryobacteraceae bacterium]|nr:cation diffusion facilitator family transporter [Bryobacteraceae bacterium]